MAGGTLRVVGLSDLGQKENPDEGIYYDDCYREDRDNYIGIILVGDDAAARNVTFVEIPALEGGYHAFYNPVALVRNHLKAGFLYWTLLPKKKNEPSLSCPNAVIGHPYR